MEWIYKQLGKWKFQNAAIKLGQGQRNNAAAHPFVQSQTQNECSRTPQQLRVLSQRDEQVARDDGEGNTTHYECVHTAREVHGVCEHWGNSE